MTRRELILSGLAGLAAGVKVEEIPAEPKPLALVLTLPDDVCADDEDIEKLYAKMMKLFQGAPPAPIVILPAGSTFEALTEPIS